MSYTIRSVRETGTITYHCTTTKMALEKVKDFQRADYLDITIAEDNENFITEGKLILLLKIGHV